MAFGEGWFSAVPTLVWIVFYVLIALTGVFFWCRSRNDTGLSGAFVLLAFFGVLSALASFGVIDALTASAFSAVVIAAAMVFAGVHAQRIA